jgi:hypothetical protein
MKDGTYLTGNPMSGMMVLLPLPLPLSLLSGRGKEIVMRHKPWLLAHRPAPGAVDVPLAATVVLTFSEPILPASPQFSSEPAADAWSVSWYATCTIAYPVPSGFAAERVYTLLLSGARDYAHNAVPVSTWSYTTAPSLTYLPLVVVNAP